MNRETFKTVIKRKHLKNAEKRPKYGMRKRSVGFVSCLLAFSMILSSVPMTAFAAQPAAIVRAAEENQSDVLELPEHINANKQIDQTISQDAIIQACKEAIKDQLKEKKIPESDVTIKVDQNSLADINGKSIGAYRKIAYLDVKVSLTYKEKTSEKNVKILNYALPFWVPNGEGMILEKNSPHNVDLVKVKDPNSYTLDDAQKASIKDRFLTINKNLNLTKDNLSVDDKGKLKVDDKKGHVFTISHKHTVSAIPIIDEVVLWSKKKDDGKGYTTTDAYSKTYKLNSESEYKAVKLIQNDVNQDPAGAIEGKAFGISFDFNDQDKTVTIKGKMDFGKGADGFSKYLKVFRDKENNLYRNVSNRINFRTISVKQPETIYRELKEDKKVSKEDLLAKIEVDGVGVFGSDDKEQAGGKEGVKKRIKAEAEKNKILEDNEFDKIQFNTQDFYTAEGYMTYNGHESERIKIKVRYFTKDIDKIRVADVDNPSEADVAKVKAALAEANGVQEDQISQDTDGNFIITYADANSPGGKHTENLGKAFYAKNDASQYEPIPSEKFVNPGETVKAEDLIINKQKDPVLGDVTEANKLPEDAEFTFVDDKGEAVAAPDTSKIGDVDVKVKVTYKDGTWDIVDAKVHVVAETATIDVVQKDNGDVELTVKKQKDGSNYPEGSVVTLPKDSGLPETVTVGKDGKVLIKNDDLKDTDVTGNASVTEKGKQHPSNDVRVTIPAKKTFELPEKTLVGDKKSLTIKEKGTIVNAIKKKNPSLKAYLDGAHFNWDEADKLVIEFADGAKKEIPLDDLVVEKTKTPTVDKVTTAAKEVTGTTEPGAKVKLTFSVTGEVVEATANKDGKFTAPVPANLQLSVDDTIKVVAQGEGKLISDETPAKVQPTDADTVKVETPDKTLVNNPSKLTVEEKDAVKKAIEDKNKDEQGKSKLPEGTTIAIGDDGTATITFPDKSTSTIDGNDLVKQSQATIVTPNVPEKTGVKDPAKLTDDEKAVVKKAIEEVNKDTLPEGTTVDVADNGDATITYKDGSKDIIPGTDLVEKKAEQTESIDPNDPVKTKVDNPAVLTKDEKDAVKKAVEDANKEKFPEGTKVDVADNGTVTVTYPDKSQDTIPADKTVEEETALALNDPAKVKVDNLAKLTAAEKGKVKEAVKKANPDLDLKDDEITVDDTGKVVVTRGNKTGEIPAAKTVEEDTALALKDPAKVKVQDPNNLTDAEKDAVKAAVKKANPTLSDQALIEVDAKGNVTVKDGNKTGEIPADKTVEEDAQLKLNAPAKVKVQDLNNLTDAEKDAVKAAVKKANPTLSDQALIEVDAKGNVTVKDGNKTGTISADKTVIQQPVDKEVPAAPETHSYINLTPVNTGTTSQGPSHQAEVKVLFEKKYMNGYGEGVFGPKATLTRAEAAQILANALNSDGYTKKVPTQYKDLDAKAWYMHAVETVTAAGVFTGYEDGNFKPNQAITRAEWIATLARFQNLQKSEGNSFNLRPDHWALPEIEAANKADWLTIYKDGTAVLDADAFIPREEVAAITNKAFKKQMDKSYLKRNEALLVNYKDVDKNSPYYEDILAASNDLYRLGNDGYIGYERDGEASNGIQRDRAIYVYFQNDVRK